MPSQFVKQMLTPPTHTTYPYPDLLQVAMVFGVPPLVCFVVLVPYELTQETPNGGVYITSTTVFVMVRSCLQPSCNKCAIDPCELVDVKKVLRCICVVNASISVPLSAQLSLFNILRFPLVVLPKALKAVSEAYNATNNLEKFLAEPAAPKQDLEGQPEVHFNKVKSKPAFCKCQAAAVASQVSGCVISVINYTEINYVSHYPCSTPSCSTPSCSQRRRRQVGGRSVRIRKHITRF